MKENSVEWLKSKGFDGLYYPGTCACVIDDHCPCGEAYLIDDCVPGYKHIDPSAGNDDYWCVSPNVNPPSIKSWAKLWELYSND